MWARDRHREAGEYGNRLTRSRAVFTAIRPAFFASLRAISGRDCRSMLAA